MADPSYKYFGLMAIGILVLGLLWIVIKWPQGWHLSFSQHVAKRKFTIVYYTLLFAIVLPLLLLFFLKWFMPAHRLSGWFGFFVAASSAAQFACTLIPEVGGWKTRYHRLLAGISAVLLLPGLAVLLCATSVGSFAKVVTAASLIVMFGIIVALVKGRGSHPRLLLLQATYFTAFFIPTIYISYF